VRELSEGPSLGSSVNFLSEGSLVRDFYNLRMHLEMYTISCKDDVIAGAFAVPVIRGLGGDYQSDIDNLEYKDRTFIVVAKSRFTFPRDHLLTPAMYNAEYPHFFHTEQEIDDMIVANNMQRQVEDITDGHVEDSCVHSDTSSVRSDNSI